MADWDAEQTCLITVTYGRRADLLRQCLAAALDGNGIGRAIVVRNGPVPGSDEVLAGFAPRVDLIDFPRNVGSAAAFGAGIARALAGGAKGLLLLDDDNIIEPGGMAALLAARRDDPDAVAFPARWAALGTRPAHGAREADIPARSSFLNFDLRRKLGWAKAGWAPAGLPYAPYGGLFAHRALFEAIGLPRADIVLYADDTEYTSRIVASGGRIVSVPGCRILDADASWNRADPSASYLVRLLEDGSDFRVYYSIRNRVWFDSRIYARGGLAYRVNAAVFCLSLLAMIVRHRRFGRGALLTKAILHGWFGRLGPNARYPLP